MRNSGVSSISIIVIHIVIHIRVIPYKQGIVIPYLCTKLHPPITIFFFFISLLPSTLMINFDYTCNNSNYRIFILIVCCCSSCKNIFFWLFGIRCPTKSTFPQINTTTVVNVLSTSIITCNNTVQTVYGVHAAQLHATHEVDKVYTIQCTKNTAYSQFA